MKKLLLIAATSTAFLSSFSAVACEGCEPETAVPVATVTTLTTNVNPFYVKIEGGVGFLNKTKFKYDKLGIDQKMKSKAAGTFGIGAGYYLTDNIRTDLTFNMLVNPQFKATIDPQQIKKGNKHGQISNEKVIVKKKGQIMAVLLNGYVDLFPLGDVAKVFVGAGAGWAQVKEKITVTVDGISVAEGKTKKANNFTYQATVGVSADLTEGVKGELFYSFKDYGKTKGFKTAKSTVGKTSYKSHDIMLGLRFSM